MNTMEQYRAALEQSAQAQANQEVLEQQYQAASALRDKQHQQPVANLMGGLGAGGVGGALQALSVGMDNAQGFKESKQLEQQMREQGAAARKGALEKALNDYQNQQHKQQMDKEKLRLERARLAQAQADASQTGVSGKQGKYYNTRSIASTSMDTMEDAYQITKGLRKLHEDWKPEYGNIGIPGKWLNEQVRGMSRTESLAFINSHFESEKLKATDEKVKEGLVWWANAYKLYINPEIKQTSGAAVSQFEQFRNDMGNLLDPSQSSDLTSKQLTNLVNIYEGRLRDQFSMNWDNRSYANETGMIRSGERYFGDKAFNKENADPRFGWSVSPLDIEYGFHQGNTYKVPRDFDWEGHRERLKPEAQTLFNDLDEYNRIRFGKQKGWF